METLTDCVPSNVNNLFDTLEREIDRNANDATDRLAVLEARIEPPLAPRFHGRPVEFPVTAGFLHLHVQHVAGRVDGDIQNHLALVSLAKRLDRILGRVRSE